MKIIGYFLLGVIVLVLLGAIGSGLNLITIPWLKFDRQVEMNRDIVTKTYNADNALYNYHWFQERAGSIKTTQEQAVNAHTAVASFEDAAGPRIAWTFEDKNEDARLRSVQLGLENHYRDLVNEYNARAGEADRGIFKDSLPLFFSLNPF